MGDHQTPIQTGDLNATIGMRIWTEPVSNTTELNLGMTQFRTDQPIVGSIDDEVSHLFPDDSVEDTLRRIIPSLDATVAKNEQLAQAEFQGDVANRLKNYGKVVAVEAAGLIGGPAAGTALFLAGHETPGGGVSTVGLVVGGVAELYRRRMAEEIPQSTLSDTQDLGGISDLAARRRILSMVEETVVPPNL